MPSSATVQSNGATLHQNGPEKLKCRSQSLDADDHAVLALRNLLFDLCHQYGGGHGGSAIGMAAIGVALWKHVMRYSPSNPSWFIRDRFVLSHGHTSMFLYSLNHLTGFENFTMDELKGYGSAKTNGYNTICHSHPEIEVHGIEVTTGPSDKVLPMQSAWRLRQRASLHDTTARGLTLCNLESTAWWEMGASWRALRWKPFHWLEACSLITWRFSA